MSDNIPDGVEGNSESSVFIQPHQSDLLNSFMMVPVTKLDADQYVVTDLDGVTEGVFGSGNMNFLMMQAGQTDDMIRTGNLFDMVGGNDTPESILGATAGNIYAAPASATTGFDFPIHRAGETAPDHLPVSDFSGSHASHAAVGSISASALASNDTHSLNPFTSVTGFSGGTSSTSTNTPVNGTSGTSGHDGSSGHDGTNGNGITIIDGDTINNVTNNAGDLLTTIIDNAGDITNNAVTNIFDTINHIIDIVDGGHLGPIGLDLNATLDDLTHLNLDILHGNDILNVINQTIDLSAITTPVTDLLGDITAGLDLHVLLDPFQYDNSATDTDLHIGTDLGALGIPLLPELANIDIPLDPVEALVGDLDINLNVADTLTDLLHGGLLGGGAGADHDLGLNLGGQLADLPLVGGITGLGLNPVEDLLGDIDLSVAPAIDLLHMNNSPTDNGAGDTDLRVPLDIELAGGHILNHVIDIPLDPVEAITGDIDLDLTASINAIGHLADSLIDNYNGGSDSPNLLSNAGDLAQNLLSPILPLANNGDTDLALGSGLQILDHTILNNDGAAFFGPVTDLMGDLDLGLYPDADILGGTQIGNVADSLLDHVTGGSDNGNLLSQLGDQLSDLTGSLLPATDAHDIGLGDIGNLLNPASDIFEVTSDAPSASTGLLDSIMNPLGQTIDTALDTLQSAPNAGGLNLDILHGNPSDLPTWTENTLPDAGNILGSGLDTDLSHLIPDPVVLSNVIPLVTNPLQDLGHSLSGGRHFGGLFG